MKTIATKLKQKFETFGEALEYVVKNKGISFVELSKLWGKSKSQVSTYVNNTITPRARNIREVEKILNTKFLEKSDHWIVEYDLPTDLNEPELPYVSKEDIKQGGPLSRDEILKLLEQIELLSKIVRDSLK